MKTVTSAALIAAAIALVAGKGAVAGPSQYMPPQGNLPTGYTWSFLGCRASDQGLASACSAEFGGSGTPPVTAEYNGRRPDYSTCGGSTPYASWCGTFAPVVPDPKCIRSCSDNGAYLIVGSYGDSVACLGSDSKTCTWFTDPQCLNMQPLAKPITTVATDALCPVNPSGGWCKEAWGQLKNGQGQTDCGVPIPPSPGETCKAPTGGPDYGGSAWTCVRDPYTPESWVPVKLTAWGQAACMSRNSRDCIWAPRECCESIAASGTATSPYFECGPIHAAAWGNTGYEDPDGWCTQALKALGGTPPPPPPPMPDRDVQLCVRAVTTDCVGGRVSNPTMEAFSFCKQISGNGFAGLAQATYIGESGCGAYGYKMNAICMLGSNCQGNPTSGYYTKWVRGASGDGACKFPSPNNVLDTVNACTAACNVGNGGLADYAWSEYECRGSELYCQCVSRFA